MSQISWRGTRRIATIFMAAAGFGLISLTAWAVGLEARGLALAPVTALIRVPEGIAVPAAAGQPATAAR